MAKQKLEGMNELPIKVYSHKAKANAKAKKTKEQSEEIKEKNQTSNKIFLSLGVNGPCSIM